MNYLGACLFLYLSHAIPSAPGVRERLVAWLGARVFRVLYSLVSLASVVWFVWAYGAADMGGAIYSPPPGVVWATLIVVPIAIFLMVARLMTTYGELINPVNARGIYRVTRFPGSWGILLWALVHVAATGDLKRVIAFGTFALIAATALIKNEAVIRRAKGEDVTRFVDATGIIPFSAIIAGRQRFSTEEIGLKIPVVSFLVIGMVLALHPVLFGINPLQLIP